ncbi:MAG: ribose-phosphate pyrophosphokinase [Bacteroidia bacterium]
MERILFALPGNELLAKNINEKIKVPAGELIVREFPDGEAYVRVLTGVSGKEAIIVCTLHHPNDKIFPLFFLAKNLRELGAKKITLITPYLAYMRQDKKFNPGEAVTSMYFAELLSSFTDEIITIDPHLHRIHKMSDVYSVTCKVLHASELISQYIKEKIQRPLLIGPDEESEQWVSNVAERAGAPYIVLQKERLGDKNVKITVPQVEKYKDHTPVLVDDIISTAHTMIETVDHLRNEGMKPPVCIGVHAVFAGNAFEELKNSGVKEIVTCNTIAHSSNGIDVAGLLVKGLD